MRVAYLGPEGTFTQEALIGATAGRELELVPVSTIYDTVMAVHQGTVDRAPVSYTHLTLPTICSV